MEDMPKKDDAAVEETNIQEEAPVQNEEERQEVRKKKRAVSLRKEIFEWVFAILFAVALTLVLKFFVFDIVRVDGHSMESTLVNEDKVILWKLGYQPQRQDVIVLDSNYVDRQEAIEQQTLTGWDAWWFEVAPPEEYKTHPYIKRVIGLPGDTVDIRDNTVYVNGEALEEPYLDEGTIVLPNQLAVPVEVPEGHVFVMGDNRPLSLDSRSSELGFVPLEAVTGKAIFRILPLGSMGPIE